MSATAPAKVCIHCGEDCSSRPRTKDAQGRYACKACHERAMERARSAPVKVMRPAEEPEIEIAPDDDAAMLAGLVDQVKVSGEDQMAMAAQPCHSCSAPMMPGAVICTNCGYNAQTGKRLKVGKLKAEGEGGGGAAAMAGNVAKGSAAILFSALGGAVGGGIGAAIWAALAYNLHVEIGWVAWGVGVMTGFGVVAVAQKHAGVITGLIAVGIAIVSICAGKYAAVSMMVDDAMKDASGMMQLTDEDMIQITANQLIGEYEAAGKPLKWPAGMGPDEAALPEDYPADLWNDAEKRWNALSAGERDSRREAFTQEMHTFVKAAVAEEGFIETFGPVDIIFGLLAIASAFSIGAGGKFNE